MHTILFKNLQISYIFYSDYVTLKISCLNDRIKEPKKQKSNKNISKRQHENIDLTRFTIGKQNQSTSNIQPWDHRQIRTFKVTVPF